MQRGNILNLTKRYWTFTIKLDSRADAEAAADFDEWQQRVKTYVSSLKICKKVKKLLFLTVHTQKMRWEQQMGALNHD